MEYRRFRDDIALRIDRGEEVMSVIREVAEKEKIRTASVEGIGAADHVVVGLYNVAEKKYHPTELNKAMEITSLAGSVTEGDGAPYLHLHITLADETGRAFGGHLNECRIGGTCELFLHVLDGEIGRNLDNITDTGLNLWKFQG